MNRTGTVPQSLRGMPGGFGGGQQAQHTGRAGANRLPNGKLAMPVNNGAGWAFGGVGPMGSGGMQNPNRPMGGAATFAQSLAGSTPATPIDLSEFPQLSNNAQMSGAAQPSMWGGQVARNMSGPARNPSVSIPQQGQQDDLFAPVSRMSFSQNSFRFGSQGSIGQSQQPQQQQQHQASSGEEFPPLNRNNNGEIGQERNANLMAGLGGFGAQSNVTSPSAQTNRSGNGLLNAVTANARTSEVHSPVGTRPSDSISPLAEEEARRKSTLHDDGASPQVAADAAGQGAETRNPLGAIGNEGSTNKLNDVVADAPSSAVQDPLPGMSAADKFGIKGLLALMAKYPSYSALVHGMNPADFGLDLNSDVPFSEQSLSLFDHAPPKPPLPKFNLPECYTVRNTQPIEQKVTNFTEETLLYMFYANPQDRHQFLAAQQLYLRGWRWHKTMRCWLTKDTEMQPVLIAPDTERGYYIIWNTATWSRERRELVLVYQDLESLPDTTSAPHA